MRPSMDREHLSFERILFFSDAVFAISITLLVLEIKVPLMQQEFSELQLGYALLQMTPKIVGFLISFFLIGQTWIEHHRICSYLGEYNSGMLWRNLWLLLFVVFLPFATALLSDYYFSRVAICVYGCSFAGLGFAKAFFWHHAVKKHLLAKDIVAAQAARIGRRVWATPITSFAVIIAAVVGIPYAYCGFALIPLAAILLDRTVARKKNLLQSYTH
ncbi:MAG: TMEM175 family protein [Ignavibacteriales bacterium]|nr:TMEM175 family protein [Ignavibacteriales bacterium]